MDINSPIARFALVADTQYADSDTKYGRNYRRGKDHLASLVNILNDIPDIDFVFNLGDLVNGDADGEFPLMLDVFSRCRHTVRHTIGNHDLVKLTTAQAARLCGIDSFFYDFSIGDFRFIALDSMDESIFSPPGSDRLQRAKKLLNANPRKWDFNGQLSPERIEWLHRLLTDASAHGQRAIILTHIPILPEAACPDTVAWNHEEMLQFIDNHPNVVAWLAGHEHAGGCVVRNGVLHKCVMGNCETEQPTASIVTLYHDRMELSAIGMETETVHNFIQ